MIGASKGTAKGTSRGTSSTVVEDWQGFSFLLFPLHAGPPSPHCGEGWIASRSGNWIRISSRYGLGYEDLKAPSAHRRCANLPRPPLAKEPHPPYASVRSPFPVKRGRLDRFAIGKQISIFSRQCLCRRTIESFWSHTEGVPTFPACGEGGPFALRMVDEVPNVPKNGAAVF